MNGRCLLLALLTPACATTALIDQRPPNVVVIFTDDQGWQDVGVFGAEGFETPHLDRMAAEGVRFTDFYTAQPVCSASRAALLTGCYSNRIGIKGAFGPYDRRGLDADEVTLAELCRSKGYTTAIFGKWHLGHLPPFLPSRHGFDTFYGTPYSNDMWPQHPNYGKFPEETTDRKRGFPPLPILEDDGVADPEVTAEDQARFTTTFTDRAVAFIAANKADPFFLYVAHPMPHIPLFVSEEYEGTTEHGLYGDVIAEIDASVGRILDALEQHDIDDRTLVIFTSDNGPWLSYGDHGGSAGGLREGKGTTFEGGVRVPCVMRWPGRIPAGHVSSEPAMTIDVLPTVAGLIDAPLPEHPIDGRDIWPLISGVPNATSPQRAYYFYYDNGCLQALRAGRWKLHFPHGYRTMEGRSPGRDGSPGSYDYSRKTGLELYDLVADRGEIEDVAASHPEVVARLQALGDEMRRELGDRSTGVEGVGVRPCGRALE
jgi:arylsulfatase A-like enzyme